MKHYFTSESVTEGHPDKMCDQISDAVLDAIYAQDPQARVACECATTTGVVLIMGEITANCNVDFQAIARNTIVGIGYNRAKFGFDGETCSILLAINKQSSDIALGVDKSKEAKEGNIKDEFTTGAGDQGLMLGFACSETPELMPMPIMFAHKLARRLAEVRKSGEINYLRPDGKTQVTIEYDNDRPVRCEAIVVSSQHEPEISQEQIHKDIYEKVIVPVIPKEMLDENTKFFINPTGRFVIGGPMGDSGLTGRKIIVDTYGGYARHGGGAFSGKDPTKVDRSACYMARYIAKNIVAAGIATKCEIEIAYAIGVANPVSVFVDAFGTSALTNEQLSALVSDNFDLRPAAIISYLDLRRPIYKQIAAYGHFGREDLDLPWERTDMAAKLAEYVTKIK